MFDWVEVPDPPLLAGAERRTLKRFRRAVSKNLVRDGWQGPKGGNIGHTYKDYNVTKDEVELKLGGSAVKVLLLWLKPKDQTGRAFGIGIQIFKVAQLPAPPHAGTHVPKDNPRSRVYSVRVKLQNQERSYVVLLRGARK